MKNQVEKIQKIHCLLGIEVCVNSPCHTLPKKVQAFFDLLNSVMSLLNTEFLCLEHSYSWVNAYWAQYVQSSSGLTTIVVMILYLLSCVWELSLVFFFWRQEIVVFRQKILPMWSDGVETIAVSSRQMETTSKGSRNLVPPRTVQLIAHSCCHGGRFIWRDRLLFLVMNDTLCSFREHLVVS